MLFPCPLNCQLDLQGTPQRVGGFAIYEAWLSIPPSCVTLGKILTSLGPIPKTQSEDNHTDFLRLA